MLNVMKEEFNRIYVKLKKKMDQSISPFRSGYVMAKRKVELLG